MTGVSPARVWWHLHPLSFLGAGPQRPFATWGRIISDGQDFITTAWWVVTIPGLFIAVLVIGVNLLGDGIRDGGFAVRRFPVLSRRKGASA